MGVQEQLRIIVVGGPTGSGKSVLALALAERLNGAIINADAMQLYRELRILTARPTNEQEVRVPHRLYGIQPAAKACSAASWREMAIAEITSVAPRLPILVGGSGLYLSALMSGLAPVPKIPQPVREAARDRHRVLGSERLHAELTNRDASMADRLDPSDSQRLIRAWEVMEATGRSLAEWQQQASGPPAGFDFRTILLAPPRAVLYATCDTRFLSMVERGAIDEVERLLALGLDRNLPAMKALGMRELGRYIAGELDLDRAITQAQQATRNYAKRQLTWFRHQPPWNQAERVDIQLDPKEKFLENISDDLITKIVS